MRVPVRSPRNLLPAEETVLTEEVIGPLAPITVRHPRGTYPLTPASRICLEGISRNPHLFHGIGLDWGCGTGCLAIAAAKLAHVRWVIALDVLEQNVAVARENARLNRVTHRVTTLRADSFLPLTGTGRAVLDEIRGELDFVIANPPASEGDDGFSFRRLIVRDALEYLKEGGSVFLQVSFQYGPERIHSLCTEPSDGRYRHDGVVATTPWVPFDLDRADLGEQVEDYVETERSGGVPYTFGDPRARGEHLISAETALKLRRESGLSPLSRWQFHRFTVVRK
ncbi:MAG: methyltransferase [Gemmatimonadales bacterium]